MYNEDGTIGIVFSGEIYNFKEIRPDLEKRGHKFSSNTDTEVIIHAYEEYGVDCLKILDGIFAFAIWDSKKKKLFIARDRLGERFVYYYFKDGKLLFASEIKALLLPSGYVRCQVCSQFMPDNSNLSIRSLTDGSTAAASLDQLESDFKSRESSWGIKLFNFCHSSSLKVNDCGST